MLAARWDTAADLGGSWTRTFRRRTTGKNPTDLLMIAPVSVQVWDAPGALDARDQPRPPTIEGLGAVTSDRKAATVTLTRAQLAQLGVGQWETAVLVTDAATGEPVVLSRGYIAISGSVVDW